MARKFFRRYRRKGRKMVKRTRKSLKGKSLSRKVSMLAKSIRHLTKFDETKSIQYFIAQSGITSYYNGNDGSAYTMLPIVLSCNASTLAIPQNTTAAGRVGNRVEFVSGRIKLDFWASPYDAVNNPYPMPCIVKIWIATRRDTAYQQPPSSLPSFFQAGSSVANCTGYLEDLTRPINSDLYRVYKSYTLKIGNSGVNGTGSSPGNQYFANNDFKLNRRLNINYTKWLIKNGKFNDSTTNFPTSRGLYLFMCVYSANNVGMTVGQQPVQFLGTKELKWKDT